MNHSFSRERLSDGNALEEPHEAASEHFFRNSSRKRRLTADKALKVIAMAITRVVPRVLSSLIRMRALFIFMEV